MTNDNKNNDWDVTDELKKQEQKDFLLNQENFERLMKVQRDIEAETEMRPTFKKLINALVTEEALSSVKQQLVEQIRG
ncbi:Uncharacterised protein [Legionella beliardensis]|uniref:Uncharacterized protein n=1 Tax=Legionella beliardensis TaxID=91822 RepID=A0A378JQN7_9GAMM|nr:hypothetical protein [Legionella beliardensis]STX55506.1 Uncharacterised protein [Legionella beliardensis]